MISHPVGSRPNLGLIPIKPAGPTFDAEPTLHAEPHSPTVDWRNALLSQARHRFIHLRDPKRYPEHIKLRLRSLQGGPCLLGIARPLL